VKTKLMLLFFIFSFFLISSIVRAEDKVCIYFFYGQGCPHCAEEETFLEELKQKYPVDVKEFEVYYNDENKKIFENISKAFNTVTSGVPMTFIDNRAFIGFAKGNLEIYDPRYNAYIGYSEAIENQIRKCIEIGGCDCPTEQTPVEKPSEVNQTNISVPVTPISNQTLVLPIIGEINSELPILLIGIFLGSFDGALNPCALSVLFFLISYLLALGSKSKVLKLGLVYASMVFIIYSSFMYLLYKGMLNVIYILGAVEIAKNIISAIMIIGGIIQLKDFFFYGKGISLEIPKFAKPKIESLIKRGTIPSAFILGILVSLVEIPCAGLFPLFYTAILSYKFSEISSIISILWYNIFFVMPLVILIIVFYLGLMKIEKAEKARLRTRRYMRLISGILMIILGLWFVTWVI